MGRSRLGFLWPFSNGSTHPSFSIVWGSSSTSVRANLVGLKPLTRLDLHEDSDDTEPSVWRLTEPMVRLYIHELCGTLKTSVWEACWGLTTSGSETCGILSTSGSDDCEVLLATSCTGGEVLLTTVCICREVLLTTFCTTGEVLLTTVCICCEVLLTTFCTRGELLLTTMRIRCEILLTIVGAGRETLLTSFRNGHRALGDPVFVKILPVGTLGPKNCGLLWILGLKFSINIST